MDLLTVSGNNIEFGFITQQIEASAYNCQAEVDLICKCYNLFLLFFYFLLLKFVIETITHVFSKVR